MDGCLGIDYYFTFIPLSTWCLEITSCSMCQAIYGTTQFGHASKLDHNIREQDRSLLLGGHSGNACINMVLNTEPQCAAV